MAHTQNGRTKTAHVYVNLMAQSFCWLLFWMTFWVEIGDQHLEFVAKIRYQHRYRLYDIASTLTAIIGLHYRVAAKMALSYRLYDIAFILLSITPK